MHRSISYTAIGRNIRAARRRANITQEQMAERMNMSLLHYGRLERAQRRVSLDQLDQIAQILHVPLSRLCEGMHVDAQPCETGETALGTGVEQAAAGCTEDARGLMLSICRMIAAHDKQNRKLEEYEKN